MNENSLSCQVCGSPLKPSGNGFYVCPCCHSSFQEELTKEEQAAILAQLNVEKMEKLASARSNLFSVTHETYLSKERILNAITQVKSLYPNDVMANFYDAFLRDKNSLAEYLLSFDANANASYLSAIVEFTIANLELPYVVALKDLVDRGFMGKQKYDYNSKIEAEVEKLNEGIYNLDIDMDVFVCYASKDMKQVVEITNFLESQGLTCFVALRNLRHGIGSLENYAENIYKAMRHCKSFVFLSSKSSRLLSCDALRYELPYLRDNLPTVKRFEYLIDEYSTDENKIAMDLISKTFTGTDQVNSLDELVNQLCAVVFDSSSYREADPPKNVKFCVRCLTENPLEATTCIHCGKTLFMEDFEAAVSRYKEILAADKAFEDQKKEKQQKLEEWRKKTTPVKSIPPAPKKKVSELATGEIFEFGSYQGKPIQWKVYFRDEQNRRILLLSNDVIEVKAFSSKKFMAKLNNYAKSDIRQWLNNDFYNTSFTAQEKASILLTDVDNGSSSVCQEKNRFLCENTKDNVFLLSLEEVTDSKYGYSYHSSEDALLRKAKNLLDGEQAWMLRSPDPFREDLIHAIDDDGRESNHVASYRGGVRPALYVKMD